MARAEESVLKCESCGADNADDADVCRGCGRPLEAADVETDDESDDSAPAAGIGETSAEAPPARPAEWRGILVIVGVFAVVLAAWFLWSPPKAGDKPADGAPAATEAVAAQGPKNEVKEIEVAGDIVWVGTSEGIFAHDRKTGAQTQYLDAAAGLPHNFVDGLLYDRNGVLWVSGWGGGVGAYDGKKWTYHDASTTGAKTVVCMLQDGAGKHWFGTSGAGVFKLDGTTWTQYARKDGLPDDEANAIAEDADGSLWVGTSSGVAHFKNGQWKVYRASAGLANEKVLAIVIDKQGVKWFGTWGGGISRFDGTSWRTFASTPEGPRSPFVLSARMDPQGRLWFGTHDGVAMLDGAAWTYFTAADGLLGSDVYAIEIDADGNKWFGTYRGLSRLGPDHREWKAIPH